MTLEASAAPGSRRAGYLLLLLSIAAVLWGGLRDVSAWTAWAAVLMLLSILLPPGAGGLERSALWLLWLSWSGLTALAGLEPMTSLQALSRQATVLWFLAVAAAWWEEEHKRAWLVLLWALAVIAGIAWFADLWLGLSWGEPTGLFPPNRNYTGALLAAAAASAAWAALSEEPLPPAARTVLALLGAVFLGVILGTQSRGALVALAGALILGACLRGSPRLLMGLLLAGALGLALLPVDWLWTRVFKLHDASAYSRPHIWSAALGAALDRPWTGVGPGLFERAYFLYRAPLEGWVRFGRYATHAHSEPLQILAEQGVFGLVLFGVALGAHLPRRRGGGWVREGASGAVWAVLIHSLVDGILALPGLWIVFLGGLAASGREAPASPGPGRMRAWGVAGLLLVAVSWYQAGKVEAWTAEAHGSASPSRAAELLGKVSRLRPSDAFLRAELARAELLSSPSQPARALAHLDSSLRSNPGGALFWAQEAEIFLRLADPETARECAKEAVRLEPNFVAAHMLLAETARAKGDRSAARAHLRRAEGIRSAFSRRVNPRMPIYEARLAAADYRRLKALREYVRGGGGLR